MAKGSEAGREAPTFIKPMAAQVVRRLPEGGEWMYELKFDGYRALILKNGTSIQIRSRNEKDLTSMYPAIHTAGLDLSARTAVIDGELLAVDAGGRPSFQALQHRSAYPDHSILFYAFDLLHLDGRRLTGLTLTERRQHLARVVGDSDVRLSEELPGAAADVIEAVRGLGLEGIIAKRRDSRYLAGHRTDAWQKLKLERQQEFVIGGYRPGPHGVDALLVGVYDALGSLHYTGYVRAGFTPHLRREVFTRLRAIHVTRCPFVDLPNSKTSHWGGGITVEQMAQMQWVKPALVTQVRFVEWTADDHLRHAAFVGLRLDKRPREVRREGDG
jgi:bifunctional non-homologous end joining protein LigD